jgi:hypothetical protein
VPVGINSFARPGPGDPLAEAAAAGPLWRAFQGYVADPSAMEISLGASAIRRLPVGYAPNAAGAFVFAVGDMTARFGDFARPCLEITQALVAGGDRECPSPTKPGRFKMKPEARAWTRLIASCFDACLRAKDARLPQLV